MFFEQEGTDWVFEFLAEGDSESQALTGMFDRDGSETYDIPSVVEVDLDGELHKLRDGDQIIITSQQ